MAEPTEDCRERTEAAAAAEAEEQRDYLADVDAATEEVDLTRCRVRRIRGFEKMTNLKVFSPCPPRICR